MRHPLSRHNGHDRTCGWLDLLANDPGRVKTCASGEYAELSSPFSSFGSDWQNCSFPIQRNRDKSSTRKFDVGVFTQAGPNADLRPIRAGARCGMMTHW